LALDLRLSINQSRSSERNDLLRQRRPQPHVAGFDSGNLSDAQQKAVDAIHQMNTDAFWIQAAHDNGIQNELHAAQKLRREWIGIDVTHLAISLIEKGSKTLSLA
jgi:hypothetical protein